MINHTVVKKAKRKHTYKVNFSVAAHICRAFLRLAAEECPIDVMALLSRELIPIREDRQYNRLQTAYIFKIILPNELYGGHNDMTLNYLITKYLQYCKTIKRLDDHTLKAYMTDLKQFCDHFNDKDINNISAQNIENFISILHEKFKPRTVKRKVSSFKAFYHYLEYRDILSSNPFSKINTKFREPITLPKNNTIVIY